MHADGVAGFEDFSLDSLIKVLKRNQTRRNDPKSTTFSISFPFRCLKAGSWTLPSQAGYHNLRTCAGFFVLHHWSDNNLKLIKNSCLVGRSDGSFSPSSWISFAEIRRTFFAPISNSEVEKSKVQNRLGADETFPLKIEGLITRIRNVVLWNGSSGGITLCNPIKVWMFKVNIEKKLPQRYLRINFIASHHGS